MRPDMSTRLESQSFQTANLQVNSWIRGFEASVKSLESWSISHKFRLILQYTVVTRQMNKEKWHSYTCITEYFKVGWLSARCMTLVGCCGEQPAQHMAYVSVTTSHCWCMSELIEFQHPYYENRKGLSLFYSKTVHRVQSNGGNMIVSITAGSVNQKL